MLARIHDQSGYRITPSRYYGPLALRHKVISLSTLHRIEEIHNLIDWLSGNVSIFVKVKILVF